MQTISKMDQSLDQLRLSVSQLPPCEQPNLPKESMVRGQGISQAQNLSLYTKVSPQPSAVHSICAVDKPDI